MYPVELQPLIGECLPLCRALGEGRYAVSIGGSYGKDTFDRSSDVDFRLFCERRLSPGQRGPAQTRLDQAIRSWAGRGTLIDGCWVRTIGEIDAQLDAWEAGMARPEDRVWTIWGYHVLTDINNQMVVEDPFGIIAGWQARLSTYPPALKKTILKCCLASVHYWRTDYHYRNKVARGDRVFLAGLSSKLVHELIEILFALNEVYYVGDGNNLGYVARFQHVPDGFCDGVAAVLYPSFAGDPLQAQYDTLMGLIDGVVTLVEQVVS